MILSLTPELDTCKFKISGLEALYLIGIESSFLRNSGFYQCWFRNWDEVRQIISSCPNHYKKNAATQFFRQYTGGCSRQTGSML